MAMTTTIVVTMTIAKQERKKNEKGNTCNMDNSNQRQASPRNSKQPFLSPSSFAPKKRKKEKKKDQANDKKSP